MPTITVLTAARTLAIEAASIVNAAIVAGDFILYKQNGDEINLGVVGPYVPTNIEAVNTVATSGAGQVLPDVSVATINKIGLSANCIFTFPTAAVGKSFLVELKQDVTGARTATWPSTVRWVGGTTPVLSTEGNKRDLFRFYCIDGTTWIGEVVGLNIAS